MELLYILAGLAFLVFGGDYLVKGASGLALRLDVSPMLVGLTVVSLGTSAPELLVSVSAALKGKPDIAIGNVVGSNIANVGLILGVTALIFPIAIKKRTLSFDWAVMMGATILFFVLSQDGQLGLWEGIVFLAALGAYIIYSFSRERSTSASEQALPADLDLQAAQKPYWLLIIIIIAGSIALVIGANWLVEGAEIIARNFGVSDRVIAITLVAFGTSLPELAASVIAAFKGQKDISLGNIIGSNLYNVLAILGITSIIQPVNVAERILQVDMYWLLATSFAILPIGIIGWKIGRIGGALFVAAYAVFIYVVLLDPS